jgi:L-asparaginase II
LIPVPATPFRAPGHVPIAVTTRGRGVESIHWGSVAVADLAGRVLHAAGEPGAVVFTRSALKPLQALPFVRDGGPARFGYDRAQLALLCASHSGEARHVDAVRDMLARAGNGPDDLQCGTHVPGHFEVRGEVPPPPPYSPLAHNCSGKHAGMLACCTLHGWRTGDYLDPGHPLQREIRAAVATFSGVAEGDLALGIDGCSAPNYALPLAALARAYARLAAADAADPDFGAAPATLRDAMVALPEMVSGAGRSDAALMAAGRGDWVAKIGAEGVQAIGIASLGIGIAVKVADGAKRALLPAVVAVLDQLGVLDAGRRAALAPLAQPDVTNYRALVTGTIEPVVELEPR